MLDYDIAAVDYEKGMIEPLPDWAKFALSAKWYGVAPWELAAHEDADFWNEVGILMRGIEADANRRASKGKT